MTGEDDEACRASPIESAITNDDASRPIQSRKRNWDQLVAVDRAAAIIEETMRQKPSSQLGVVGFHTVKVRIVCSWNPKSIDDATRLAENLMDTISEYTLKATPPQQVAQVLKQSGSPVISTVSPALLDKLSVYTSRYFITFVPNRYNNMVIRHCPKETIMGHKKGDGFTTMCFKGRATSRPPACLTNSAGVRKLPWHTHTILTSSPFLYLYRNPSIFLPLGPSPVVDTHGMSSIMLRAA
ncbi:hypothetical protein F2Q69_00039652 [Brassica cretica]|uniref:Uncharacterized protein n=1 Tax=Brassica cretica TaxID=69181 RepID=A0A8S9NCU4_BRACR|nr:hypothetical protein F2Q69_00039652 [Brassica cretica]